MNGWTKIYADGSACLGRDVDVYGGHVSWRKTSMDNIVQVILEHEGVFLSLDGPGSYWQSDDFESVFPVGTKMIRRRIQKQIEPGNRFYKISSSGYQNGIIHRATFTITAGGGVVVPLRQQDVGKWLTLEYDIVRQNWHHKVLQGRM